jgi:hypothetical protein
MLREAPPGRPPPGQSATVWKVVAVVAMTGLLITSGLLVLNIRSNQEEPSGQIRAGGYDFEAPRRHRPNPQGLAVGVTHTRNSIDHWGDDDARASAKNVLTATTTYQNQHIFGWGALNPEPKPGVFDWSSLDRRMKLIQATGGTPVITLCCAPDWMKGGRAGQTDWSRLHAAPLPKHYDDFAALSVAVARRYPQVRHFLVWNEMKGFWDEDRNRWDYEAYTRFYNVVYEALKAAVPDVKIGGPYVVMDVWSSPSAGGHPSNLAGECGTVDRRSLDAVEYWLKNKRGADFVVIDGGLGTRDEGVVPAPTVGSASLGAITRWVRQRTSLPVWWSEFHVGRAGDDGQRRIVATTVAALMHVADEGASVALLWQPEQTDERGPRRPALWTSTEEAGGGRPLALAEALARMQQVLADVTDYDAVSWPVADVGVLHGKDQLIAVNTSDGDVNVEVRGQDLRLGPYEVRYVRLPPDTPPPPVTQWTPGQDRCLREQPESADQGMTAW